MSAAKRSIDQLEDVAQSAAQPDDVAQPVEQPDAEQGAKQPRGTAPSLRLVPQSEVASKDGDRFFNVLLEVQDVPAAPAKGEAEVLVMCDISSSMLYNLPKLREAMLEFKRAADASATEVNLKFAFGTYSDFPVFPGIDARSGNAKPKDEMDADTSVPFGYVPWSNLKEMDESVFRNIGLKHLSEVGRGTNMQGMVERATEVLEHRNKTRGEPVLQHLIILTDGHPNRGQTAPIIQHAVKAGIRDNTVVVHSLLLGDNLNLKLMHSLSTGLTNGVMAYANTSNELADAFGKILEPVFASPFAFAVQVCDNTSLRIEHLGILSATNCKNVVRVHVHPDQPRVSFKLLGVGAPTHAVELELKFEELDPLVEEKLHPEVEAFLKARQAEERLFERLRAEAEAGGLASAAQLAQTYAAQDTQDTQHLAPDTVQRLSAFSQRLSAAAQHTDTSHFSPLANAATVESAVSQSLY